jgi:hypothetical protein
MTGTHAGRYGVVAGVALLALSLAAAPVRGASGDTVRSATSALAAAFSAAPAGTYQAVCDLDGPCLNATSSAPGHSVTMASLSSGDASEGLTLSGYGGDYGCTEVTASCPFSNTALDSAHLGQPLIDLTFTSLSGQPAAATYPDNDVNTEALSTAPDRDVYVLDTSCGSDCVYLYSPYWTNHDGALEALYGPPKGTQASVSTFTGSTRQSWVLRSTELPAPTGVTAAESDGDLTVGWQAVTGATGYEVLICDVTAGQTAFSVASWTQDPNSSTPLADIDFSDFTAGDEYAFEVVAQDASGSSPASAQATVIAVGFPNVLYSSAGDGAVFFGWQDPPGATSYQVVQFDNCTGDYSSPIQVTAQQQQITDPDGTTSTWVEVTGLTDGQCYDYEVDAYNSTDGDYVAAISLDQLLEPLATPTWNSATAAGDGSADLVWNTATGATEYVVYMANQTTDPGDYSEAESVTPVTGATQSADVTGLTNGDTYSFYIIAEDDFSGETSTGTQSLTPAPSDSATKLRP